MRVPFQRSLTIFYIPGIGGKLLYRLKSRRNGGCPILAVGFYFRNVTEILLFGIRGGNNRTLPPGRSRVNLIRSTKRNTPASRTKSFR